MTSKPFKIAVLASTNGTDLQAIIDEINAGQMPGISLEIVLSDRDCYAIQRAQDQNIPTEIVNAPNPERDQKFIQILTDLSIDLIVLVGYMRILSPQFIQAFPQKIINVHPSLIPKYSGKDFYGQSVHEAVLANNETETGMTIHYVDEGVDTGQIILQKTCPVTPDDTPETLKQKVQDLEKKHYPEVICTLAKNPK